MTLPEKIIYILSDGKPRALHEIRKEIETRYGEYHNDASISARTREMIGKIESKREQGKPFKVWFIKEQVPVFDNSGQALMFGEGK